MAAIKALEALKWPCSVLLVSDSKYVVDANEQGWLAKWQRNGWKKSDGGDVLNQDLWERLLELKKGHQVKFKHTKGHSNDELNNRCDALAVEAARKVGQGPIAGGPNVSRVDESGCGGNAPRQE